MELVINGTLSEKEQAKLQKFTNGINMVHVINGLYKDGLTSPVKVLGFDMKTTFIVCKYEAYVLQDEKQSVRINRSNLKALLNVMEGIDNEKPMSTL